MIYIEYMLEAFCDFFSTLAVSDLEELSRTEMLKENNNNSYGLDMGKYKYERSRYLAILSSQLLENCLQATSHSRVQNSRQHRLKLQHKEITRWISNYGSKSH